MPMLAEPLKGAPLQDHRFCRDFQKTFRQLRCLPAIGHRQYHHELVAADAADGIALPYLVGELARDALQELIADRMAKRIVDVLEAVQVDEQERDLISRMGSIGQCHRCAVHQQLPIRQTGEQIIKREVVQPLVRLAAFDRDPGQVGAHRHQLFMEFGRFAWLAIIHGKGSYRAAVARPDRARPVRHQPDRQYQVAKVLPQRIVRNIARLHRMVEIQRGTAGACLGPDLRPLQFFRVGFGYAGRGDHMHPIVLVQQHDGAQQFGRDFFHAEAQLIEQLVQRPAARHRFQQIMLQAEQLVGSYVCGNAVQEYCEGCFIA
jgi:hypothetical protein